MPYFDHASTAPLHPAAREVLLAAYDEGWADPARLYRDARRARLLLDNARERVASAFGARPDEVSFPASGTASVHAAILGGLKARSRVGSHLVTTAVEHSAVLAAADWHESSGGSVTRVAVDEYGRVDAASLASAITDDTALVSVQHANHEVGTLQPIAEIGEECARRGVPLHVDAAQSVGRLRVDALPAQLVSASAHKWGGPAGVGVLVVRKRTRWKAPWPTDDREQGRAPGFPNLPGVLAAAAALDARLGEMAAEASRLSAHVERIRADVPRLVSDAVVVGDPVRRLPHLVTFSLLYVDGEAIVSALDRLGIAVNSGSSCTSSTLRPSHVLEAMGVLTHGNVRVSLGRDTTDADVDLLLRELPGVVATLRRTTASEGL